MRSNALGAMMVLVVMVMLSGVLSANDSWAWGSGGSSGGSGGGGIAAAREVAEAELVPRGAVEVEPAEAEAVGPEGVAGALAAAAQEAVEREGVAGQVPGGGAAEGEGGGEGSSTAVGAGSDAWVAGDAETGRRLASTGAFSFSRAPSLSFFGLTQAQERTWDAFRSCAPNGAFFATGAS